MDMSRLKRLAAGSTLVAFSIAGISGSQAADLSVAKTPAVAVTFQAPAVSAPAVSARVATVAPVVLVIPKTATSAVAVTAKPVVVVKSSVKRVNPRSTLSTKVTRRTKYTKPIVVPKPRTAVKRTATSKPTPRTVTRPPAASKPSVTTTAARAYQAPSISYAGSSCRKTGAGEWTITHRWTASGGTYADLGSAQNRISPVVVTGGTRTWTFVSTENGSSAPEVTDAYLGRIVAPIGKTGDVTAWRSIERSKDMVAVSC